LWYDWKGRWKLHLRWKRWIRYEENQKNFNQLFYTSVNIIVITYPILTSIQNILKKPVWIISKENFLPIPSEAIGN
jgi:hypothetical protein